MNLSFENKVALVTGSASGMGLATAKAFAEVERPVSRVIKALEDSVNCGDAPRRQIGTACA